MQEDHRIITQTRVTHSHTTVTTPLVAMIEDEAKYNVALDSVKRWNSKMMIERKMRQPYLDNTTGLAQTNCHLWVSELDRHPGVKDGQVYSYPARKWRKKKRVAAPPPPLPADVVAVGSTFVSAEDYVATGDMDPVVSLNKSVLDSSKEKWYAGMPQYEEIEDFDEFEDDFDPYGDDSDFEDSSSRRKRSKKKDSSSSRTGSRRSGRNDETDKPFPCDMCSSRYKSKQGLDHHMSHSHHIPPKEEHHQPLPMPPVLPSIDTPAAIAAVDSPAAVPHTSAPREKVKNPVPNDYCDFCLGDVSMNKKSKVPEDMVSCADCGRSGHPTCLQFTDNMKISVIKYPWQCIECKSCGLCGTSENDDQLLFCDDCDRGYHMYCLNPPLSEPPEGNWSCHLCIAEFHSGVKPDWM